MHPFGLTSLQPVRIVASSETLLLSCSPALESDKSTNPDSCQFAIFSPISCTGSSRDQESTQLWQSKAVSICICQFLMNSLFSNAWETEVGLELLHGRQTHTKNLVEMLMNQRVDKWINNIWRSSFGQKLNFSNIWSFKSLFDHARSSILSIPMHPDEPQK